jgi:hypothetical protein
MSPRASRVAAWVVAALLLLLASGWSFNLATYNWFAADFHNEYSHAYASRGNIFSIVALALFAASVSVIVTLRRSGKRKRLGGWPPVRYQSGEEIRKGTGCSFTVNRARSSSLWTGLFAIRRWTGT